MLRVHATALVLLLLPACAPPSTPPAPSPAPLQARLVLSPFADETSGGAGPVAEGLRLFLQEALARDPAFRLIRHPDERADLLLQGALLDFRPGSRAEPAVLVSELGLLDVRNGALVVSRIVTGAGPAEAGDAALPASLRSWAGTPTEPLLRAWLASALVAVREGTPSGYFAYDAAGRPVAALPPPPLRAGQRLRVPGSGPGSRGLTATVRAESASLREGPGTRYAVIGELKRGEAIEVLDERGEWSNVRAAGGLEGWVFRGLLTAPRVRPPAPGPAQER
ncbi:MAG: SH3 domain-containing protein [candidate division NC10 bacterium]|nr:SH3 domain-containing protein [candidate division NC10 bacterium]